MSRLTIRVDDDLLLRARLRASQEGTSINAIVREFLESYAGKSGQVEAVNEFLRIARENRASSGPEGRTWRREDLYKDRLGQYGRS